MLALEFKSLFIFEYLLEQGADANKLDIKNNSVLHYALISRDEIFALNLLEKGRVLPSLALALSSEGKSCYDLALEKGFQRVIQHFDKLLRQPDGSIVDQ